jgi:hypothetical protein
MDKDSLFNRPGGKDAVQAAAGLMAAGQTLDASRGLSKMAVRLETEIGKFIKDVKKK